MTPQTKLQTKLTEAGIPAKEIKVYGSQIMITCFSQGAARKWASLLSKFAKVRGVVESVDRAKQNKRTVLNPSTVKVWLVAACI